MLITSAASVLIPGVSGKMIDIIAKNEAKSALTMISLVIIGIAVISGIFGFIRGSCFNLLGEKVMY